MRRRGYPQNAGVLVILVKCVLGQYRLMIITLWTKSTLYYYDNDKFGGEYTCSWNWWSIFMEPADDRIYDLHTSAPRLMHTHGYIHNNPAWTEENASWRAFVKADIYVWDTLLTKHFFISIRACLHGIKYMRHLSCDNRSPLHLWFINVFDFKAANVLLINSSLCYIYS